MAAIKHLLHINAPRKTIFDALSTLKGLRNWWTKDTNGDTKENGIIQFRFGEYGPDMKVKTLKPGEIVKWECTGGSEDWIGTTIQFKLDEHDGKTRVRFTHSGWENDGDFYAACSFTWGRYLESLRRYCQTGKGEAFGSKFYKQ